MKITSVVDFGKAIQIRKILLQFILFCKHMFGIMYLGLGAMIRHKNNRPGLVNFGSCGGIKNG